MISSFVLFSCKNDLSKQNIANQAKKDSINSFFKDSVVVKFNFPDTVYRDKNYKGHIYYKGILDTITTSFDDSIKQRYILFYMIKAKSVNHSTEEIRKQKMDTFGALNNTTIPFRVQFTKTGTYYIDGIINDHVLIDTVSNPKSRNMVRYIEKEARAIHKVVVIEKP